MKPAALLALILTVVTSGTNAEPPERATLESLVWMAGHWRLEHGTRVVEEGWFAPSGGTMLGMNRTVSGDRTTGFEFLRLEESGGGIVLFASPGGRCPATEFTLIELDVQQAVFANPNHDFPQKITYRREDDRLHAEIEGATDGEARTTGWVFELMP